MVTLKIKEKQKDPSQGRVLERGKEWARQMSSPSQCRLCSAAFPGPLWAAAPRTGRWAQVPLELECPTFATWDAKGHPHGSEGMGRLQPVCPERARRALTVCVIRGMKKEVNRLF